MTSESVNEALHAASELLARKRFEAAAERLRAAREPGALDHRVFKLLGVALAQLGDRPAP